MTPVYRNLRGYTLDPGFSTLLDTTMINETIYRIRWEEVSPGPVGEYFDVLDYDPPSKCYYEPIDLNDNYVLADYGLPPSEGDPKFHQQFVYVIAMKTLECFEQSLGRKIIWPYRSLDKDDSYRQQFRDKLEAYKTQLQNNGLSHKKRQTIILEMERIYKECFEKENVQHIRIYPHALRDANAYYDSIKKSLLFGYFEAGHHIQNTNLPGGVVFTCLSPDIVSHEVTHAILDSIHPRFIENTNPDVPAFHEAFADLIALLQRFTIRDLLVHQLTRTGGRLDEFNLMGELATQFGNAISSGRGALRSAIGKTINGKWVRFEPDPKLYKTAFEPHERGALLVAVVFDAFIRLYKHKTEDLFRIAHHDVIQEEHSPSIDLIRRLAEEAAETARHLLQICIRALDYCPPLDITFGDYLRALVTADVDIAPADNIGYRIALIEAFRAWGIFPDRVTTLSVESLLWSKFPYLPDSKESSAFERIAEYLRPQVSRLLNIQDRKLLAVETRMIQARLQKFLRHQNFPKFSGAEWKEFMKKLGLASGDITMSYRDDADGMQTRMIEFKNPKLEVHSVRPAYRIGREGRQVEQLIVTLTQTLRAEDPELGKLKFRGGCTLILNISQTYSIEYILVKSVNSNWRFQAQVDYQNGKDPASISLTDSMYEGDQGSDQINFSHLHFHNSY